MHTKLTLHFNGYSANYCVKSEDAKSLRQQFIEQGFKESIVPIGYYASEYYIEVDAPSILYVKLAAVCAIDISPSPDAECAFQQIA